MLPKYMAYAIPVCTMPTISTITIASPFRLIAEKSSVMSKYGMSIIAAEAS